MSERRTIAIIGGGIAGLAAAYDLLRAGHAVTIYEAGGATGGLAVGFKDEAWDWSLEHFYHHIFESDKDIIGLVEELGVDESLFFRSQVTSLWHEGAIHPFSNPIDWFRFPAYNLIDFVRFGVVGSFLRFTRPWRHLEKMTAVEWTRRWYGRKIFEISWRPLLIGKFGPYFDRVNMAWLWARLYVRSFKLGYFKGGFRTFVAALTAKVEALGAEICLRAPVETLAELPDGRLAVTSAGQTAVYDQVLATIAPHLLTRLAPTLPDDYRRQLDDLKYMGAVVMVLALDQPLMDDTYWLNVTATSPDKALNDLPFLSVVEQTNFIDKSHYGGDHVVYCGDYVTPDHPYLQMDDEALADLFYPALARINPAFRPEWVRRRWLFKTTYAQPVPLLNHSGHIPALTTPWSNLFFASMSHIYPWDRGTNFAVEIGRRVAQTMAATPSDHPAIEPGITEPAFGKEL